MVIPEAAMLLASRTDIVFVICGDGMMKPEFESASVGIQTFDLFRCSDSSAWGKCCARQTSIYYPKSRCFRSGTAFETIWYVGKWPFCDCHLLAERARLAGSHAD